MNKILVTGAAGFIGFHVVKRLLDEGKNVTGLDNINTYYDIRLKYDRLNELGVSDSPLDFGSMNHSKRYKHFRFIKLFLC